jgi:dihydroorotase-like cyclic amidohydrolase
VDLLLRNARVLGRDDVVDIGVTDGRIQLLGPAGPDDCLS